MILSPDGLIQVETVKSIGDIIFGQADWTILNVPHDSARILEQLKAMPVGRHVLLAVTRHRRKDRMGAMANIGAIENCGFEYLDTVSIEYQKPSSSSNNGLLPTSEPAYLFFRGEPPDVSRTKWFRDDHNNATTSWDVGTQPGEGEPTQYQRFCWELHLLLMSLSAPRAYNRFNFVAPLGSKEYERLFQFCRTHSIGVNVYTDDEEQAAEMVESYKATFGGQDKEQP